ncbi:Cytochrome c, mono-and diheme variants [Parapedobacter composti]|uniref:Cytochrome c, mono-and diheme variants n=1 Tax=Parapedobacter composti TaxID=623281 RepID=A0A1I1H9V1_9SPHI|nr:c-type cytochrome [Parapedobacter composti]SFC20787.1 Cytochrome c, mono-and diheme variants [Parapedobacter composti]
MCVQCRNRSDNDVLSPKASINAMEVAEGFTVEVVASEPLVVAPVAMTFDGDGRIWVVEMDGYMPDTLGTGEDAPVGRVAILEDVNGDGRMDKRQVFLDSLVMPRALCLVDGGLMLAEPPRLWFYAIRDGKPAGKTLVDSAYAEGGNVEHQPNGLLRGLDNWIYSAKYDYRYRRLSDGTWQKERTHFRGQWGISQDDWGRLFYNDNSSNLSGDYFPPGLGGDNPNQRKVAGYGQTVVADTRVYPIHPTPGVNRGYMEGVLDSAGRLVNFTAACGPLVYRGGLMQGMNAFVAEPAANLVKWNVLHDEGHRVVGRQAFEGREFLASRDERFRPVNLYDGPDGGIYIVDMYRGIIQHNTYLTPYLKKEIAERKLSLPLGMGRIYRILPKGAKPQSVYMPAHTDSLVALLGHPNGWVRDQAQRTLVDRRPDGAETSLRRALHDSNPIKVVHAMWTMEGIGKLTDDDIEGLLRHSNWRVRAQAIAVIPALAESGNPEQATDLLKAAAAMNDTLLTPLMALAMASPALSNLPGVADMAEQWAMDHGNDAYVVDASISGWGGREEQLLRLLPDTSVLLYRRLRRLVADKEGKESKAKREALAKRYKEGIALFRTACQPCHGEDGKGVTPIAPPLAGSEWVTGNKERLIALVLYGLTGPVSVAGHTYDTPEVSGEMPGIAHNRAIEEAELAQLLSYIRNAWGNNAGDEVLPEDLGTVRARFGNRTEPFTQAELHEMFGKD